MKFLDCLLVLAVPVVSALVYRYYDFWAAAFTFMALFLIVGASLREEKRERDW